MAWIEGFGDEVTVFLAIALLMIIVVSALLLKSLSDFQATLNDASQQQISQPNENSTANENTSPTNIENSNHQENSENDNSTPPHNSRETDSMSRSDVLQNHIINGSSQSCEIYSNDDNTAPSQYEEAGNSNLRTFHSSNNKLSDQKQSNEKDLKLQKKHAINSEQSSTLLTNNISLNSMSRENAEATNAVQRSGTEGEHRQIGEIAIRIKYMNDTEKTVYGKLSEKIGDFKSKNFSEELSQNKMVRLIFNGQLLRTESTLSSCGLCEGSVIHANILQQDARSPPASINTNTDLDLSHLFWPLLSIILGILWVLHFKYQEIFNVTSTGILLAFTGVFFIFAFGHVRQQTGQ